MAGNSNLNAAMRAKQDEFYTQWVDIEREVNAYLEFDPDLFRDKTVLLPCDDPEWSNFTKFFALHFADFGLRKLISTSYAPGGETGPTRGRKFTLAREDVPEGRCIDVDHLTWEHFDGDGDFRSPEVTRLRDHADIIITNPPFSLFREYMAWLVEGGKKFAAIGNMNAITYKEIFPLIKANQVWLGPTIGSGGRGFRVPDSYPANATGLSVDEHGNRLVQVNARWVTNIDHKRRHTPLHMMPMEHNVRFSRHASVRAGYRHYDNYAAIEVPFTDAIPSDFDGVMGVPITFLDRFNPDQFEIVGRGEDIGWARSEDCTFFTPTTLELQRLYRQRDQTWRIQNPYLLDADGFARKVYKRIFIRRVDAAKRSAISG